MATMCAGMVTLMSSETVQAVSIHGEPTTRIQQIAGVIANRGEFQPLHRAFVGGVEHAFVLERHGGGLIFRETGGQRDADAGILRHAFGGERLVVRVGDLGEAKRVIESKVATLRSSSALNFTLALAVILC